MNVRIHLYEHTHIPPQSLAFSTSSERFTLKDKPCPYAGSLIKSSFSTRPEDSPHTFPFVQKAG